MEFLVTVTKELPFMLAAPEPVSTVSSVVIEVFPLSLTAPVPVANVLVVITIELVNVIIPLSELNVLVDVTKAWPFSLSKSNAGPQWPTKISWAPVAQGNQIVPGSDIPLMAPVASSPNGCSPLAPVACLPGPPWNAL